MTREAVTTGVLDAEGPETIEMAEDSGLPLLLAFGLFVLFIGLLPNVGFVEIFVSAIGLVICGLALFIDLSNYVLASVVVVGMVVFLAAKCRAVLERVQAIPRLRNASLRLVEMLDAVWALMRPIPLLVGGSVALAAWSCEALAFHYLVGRLGIHSSLLLSFSIYGLSTLAGALSMLPGGLGGVEAVMTFLLTRLGAATSAATVAVVIFRLCTLWLFSLIGVIFMSGWMIFFTKRRHPNLVVQAQ